MTRPPFVLLTAVLMALVPAAFAAAPAPSGSSPASVPSTGSTSPVPDLTILYTSNTIGEIDVCG